MGWNIPDFMGETNLLSGTYGGGDPPGPLHQEKHSFDSASEGSYRSP